MDFGSVLDCSRRDVAILLRCDVRFRVVSIIRGLIKLEPLS